MNILQDRCIKPRVICDYPVIIDDHGGDENNKYGRLANLSASGLYMQSNRKIETGSIICIIVLLTSALTDTDSPKISTNGIVVRCETLLDGGCGIAVKFNHYRFL
jgi:hypothetical protein